jgi:hypothetical protein
MSLTQIEESVLVATFFRGGDPESRIWASNSDQVLTLSLFYTGDISSEECVVRFLQKGYVGGLYQDDGELNEVIACRYGVLINLLQTHPELIEGGGDFNAPAFPTYTSCRLTRAGQQLACELIPIFPRKPDFQHWPDKRTFPFAD